jgi:hypothetical protein
MPRRLVAGGLLAAVAAVLVALALTQTGGGGHQTVQRAGLAARGSDTVLSVSGPGFDPRSSEVRKPPPPRVDHDALVALTAGASTIKAARFLKSKPKPPAPTADRYTPSEVAPAESSTDETTGTAPTYTPTTPVQAPAETTPVQTPSAGGGGTSTGSGSSTGGSSTPSSSNTSSGSTKNFGPGGALGPGNSPTG